MKRVVADLEQSQELEEARSAARGRHHAGGAGRAFQRVPRAIAYVLPAKPGGGGVHSIVQEATCMARHGRESHVFRAGIRDGGVRRLLRRGRRDVVAPYRNVSHLVQQLRPFTVVVATVYRSVPLVEPT